MDELETIRQKKLEKLKNEIKVLKVDALLKAEDVTFDRMLSENRLLLVDFWAEWCGPCRMIAPVVEALASDYAEKLAVAKLNVDDNPQTAMRYQTMSIPTLILFKDGKPVQRIVGVVPRNVIEAMVKPYLT